MIDAIDELRRLPFEDIDFAKIDHHRAIRCGFQEVIFCEGKSVEQVCAIVDRCAAAGQSVLATRVTLEMYDAVHKRHESAVLHDTARCITLEIEKPDPLPGKAAVVSGGTSDAPVAEEARVTLESMGANVTLIHDVGVAGLHRLLAHTEALQTASVIVAVAGMEGALPSVVGGLVSCPVIAVPTSVGYGASFAGLTALLAMLNSCASGVTVVNIDNGFGGGFAAARILRQIAACGKSGDAT